MDELASLGQINLFTAVVFLGTLVALSGLGVAVFGGQEAERRKIRRRVGRIHDRWTGTRGAESAASLKRTVRDSGIPTLDRLFKRIVPPPAQLRQRLARTGRRITLAEYVLTNFLLAGVTITVASYYFLVPPLLAVLVGIIVGVGLPYLVAGRMAGRRMNRFLKLFPDAIDLIVRGLKSGLPVAESIAIVGQELAEPVGSEFRRMADNMKLGQPLEEALWETTGRIPLTDFKFFVISLAVQKETGGNLTETLSNLSNILRRRQQMKLKIRAMSSEARASAYIIGSLPFILGVIIYLMNTEYASTLFTDPRGRLMVGAGLTWLTIGVGVMAKMVRFEI